MEKNMVMPASYGRIRTLVAGDFVSWDDFIEIHQDMEKSYGKKNK